MAASRPGRAQSDRPLCARNGLPAWMVRAAVLGLIPPMIWWIAWQTHLLRFHVLFYILWVFFPPVFLNIGNPDSKLSFFVITAFVNAALYALISAIAWCAWTTARWLRRRRMAG